MKPEASVLARARALSLALAVGLGAAAPAAAQDRDATLADIRQQLSVLSVEMQQIRRELSTTESGLPAPAAAGALERLDAIEAEVRRLTAGAEQLEHRIGRIVEDGTNRISDLQFRLTELEGGDVGQLGTTPPLGGGGEGAAAPVTAASPPAGDSTGVQLAMGETAEFDNALKLLSDGTPADSLTALDRFLESYPRSPLAAEAQFYRGEALRALGNQQEAGRAFLESYTLAEAADNGGLAGDALLNLGQSLGALGETREACLTLGQVSVRFPDTAAVAAAEQERGRMNCP